MPAWDGEADGPRGGATARGAGGALVLRVFVAGKRGNEPARVEAAEGVSFGTQQGDLGPGTFKRFQVPAGATHVEISVVEEEPGQPAR